MASLETSQMLSDLQTQGEALKSGDAAARMKVLDLCRELTCELEEPGETFLRTMWASSAYHIALRVCLELEVFTTLSADGERPKTATELAEPKGADVVLVARMLRHLAAMFAVQERDVDTFAHTRFSRALAEGSLGDGVRFMLDDFSPVNALAPKFLAQTGYQNPTDPRNTTYQTALGLPVPGPTMFEHFAQTPKLAMRFGGMMAAQQGGKRMWADPGAYPVADQLGGVEGEGVLVVDVGGGKGHDLLGMRERYPEVKGRLVLQDMPYMVKEVREELEGRGVQVMEHDFYTPQPIKGARAYLLHQILHDYSDSTCRTILSNLKTALTPGYSKILVNELVLPNRGAHWLTTALDVELMQCLASCERTEREFRALAESVGLKVSGVWAFEGGYDSVIEMVLEE